MRWISRSSVVDLDPVDQTCRWMRDVLEIQPQDFGGPDCPFGGKPDLGQAKDSIDSSNREMEQVVIDPSQ